MSAALSGEDEDQRKIKQLQQELNELEARVAVCVYSKTSTLHSVAADVKGSRLGQTVFSKILVNGVPTRALIDTGSPATIVSLDYVLDIFAEQRDRNQSPQEKWMETTKKRLSPPEVTLKNY